MSDDVAVLWLAPEPAGDQASRALKEWARARGVRLSFEPKAPEVQVSGNGARPETPNDPSLPERVEKELDRAREAIGANDTDIAERALARAEAILREHPELPQAAWLRAETERMWSVRWLRLQPRDESRAHVAWENAHALDGGRVAGVGETNFATVPRVKATLVVSGATPARVTVHLDGSVIEPTSGDERGTLYHVDVAPAEHHLLATIDRRIVFASWIAIAGPSPAPTRITIGSGDACGRAQFADVTYRASEGSPKASRQPEGPPSEVSAPGVTCPRWVAALPSARHKGVLIARCERDACGPLLEWRLERDGPSGLPQPSPRPGWPTWATWTLLGIGAATATSVALVATGVFETRPVEPRFVVGGVRQE